MQDYDYYNIDDFVCVCVCGQQLLIESYGCCCFLLEVRVMLASKKCVLSVYCIIILISASLMRSVGIRLHLDTEVAPFGSQGTSKTREKLSVVDELFAYWKVCSNGIFKGVADFIRECFTY